MYFEEFNKGEKYTTRPRIVTGTDIDILATVTGALNPLFLNNEVARKRGYKGRIAPGVLTLAINIGLQYGLGFFDHLIALLGVDGVKFLAPVNPEDEIKCNAEIAETKETKRDDRGIIVVKWDCQNQDGKKVLEGTLSFMAERKK